MVTERLLLTTEDAAKYALLTTYKERSDFVLERIFNYIVYGYGYYGLVSGKLETNGEETFVRYLRGSSCE